MRRGLDAKVEQWLDTFWIGRKGIAQDCDDMFQLQSASFKVDDEACFIDIFRIVRSGKCACNELNFSRDVTKTKTPIIAFDMFLPNPFCTEHKTNNNRGGDVYTLAVTIKRSMISCRLERTTKASWPLSRKITLPLMEHPQILLFIASLPPTPSQPVGNNLIVQTRPLEALIMPSWLYPRHSRSHSA